LVHIRLSLYVLGYHSCSLFPGHVKPRFLICSDDEVEVGADLYEIDTEAEATIEAAAVAAESAQTTTAPVSLAPAPTPTASAVSDASSTSSSQRVPSIKFLGKEGWASALTVEPEFVIPATYGRLEFSEEEIEALLSGGANLAPELKEFSTGAVFAA
jgi:pyruvate/2-oxoglutarate dehydrogenase complex dihydrolipoamide acyltransferase (E2) component